jgi:hypothetical protein
MFDYGNQLQNPLFVECSFSIEPETSDKQPGAAHHRSTCIAFAGCDLLFAYDYWCKQTDRAQDSWPLPDDSGVGNEALF